MNKNGLKIEDITLELTNRCNLRCKMCNIWREPTKKDLTLKDIKSLIISEIFDHPINSVSLTGGEPFLHPNIDKIYKFLVLCKKKGLIRSIGIYSNCYDTKLIENFLGNNEKFLNGLEIGVSIDGVKNTHNFLRGRSDAHNFTLKSLERIKNSWPSVKIETKFTICPYNFDQIKTVYNFSKKNGFNFDPKFVENHNTNYYHRNGNTSHSTSFNKEQKKSIKNDLEEILETEKAQDKETTDRQVLSFLIRYINGENVINSCRTPKHFFFVDSNANLYPCIYFPAIANLKNEDWEQGINSQARKSIIEKAENGDCPKCFAYHGFLKNFNLDRNL